MTASAYDRSTQKDARRWGHTRPRPPHHGQQSRRRGEAHGGRHAGSTVHRGRTGGTRGCHAGSKVRHGRTGGPEGTDVFSRRVFKRVVGAMREKKREVVPRKKENVCISRSKVEFSYS